MSLKDLIDERGKLLHEARGMLDRADTEGRSLAADEQERYDTAHGKIADLTKDIDTRKMQDEAERRSAEIAVSASNERTESRVEEKRMEVFRRALVTGVDSLSVEEKRDLQSTSDTAGGYLTAPEEFVNILIKAVDDMTHIRGISTTFQTDADTLGAVSLDNDPGDFTMGTELEVATSDSTMSFGKRELTPHHATAQIKVSRDLLLRSRQPIEQLIAGRFGYKLATTQEKKFLTGTGFNEPLGLLTASSDGISTGRDISTGNTTTAIQFDGLKEAQYGIKDQYRSIASWLFHRDGIKQISKLKDGEDNYLWQPSNQVGEPDRLLGHPVRSSEYVSNTFTAGLYVGLFGDFSHYWIADHIGMQMQRLEELYAATNQIGFIMRVKFDGMPTLEEAFSRITLAAS
jgi:HK97 family phage major capsid protein